MIYLVLICKKMDKFSPETAKEHETVKEQETEKEKEIEKMEIKKETIRKNPKRTVLWKCKVCIV